MPARWIEVAPERFPAWVAGFGRRHGAVTVAGGPDTVTFRAADGAVAECHPPFPPMPPEAVRRPAEPGAPERPGSGAAFADPVGSATPGAPAAWAAVVAAHAAAPRTVGVLLVRLGGYAAGVFAGSPPELVASKTGSRFVHGRSAAGGWSQHRFARRREKQAASALSVAADAADAVLGRYRGRIDVVVLGGDRRAVAVLRGDPRLRPYLALAVERFLTVPDPRLAVLRDTPRLFRSVRVLISEPEPSARRAGEEAPQ